MVPWTTELIKIFMWFTQKATGESDEVQQTSHQAHLASTDSKKEIMDSLTSVSLKISEKKAKEEHTSKGTTDFLGYQCKDSLEYKYTDWDIPGEAFEGETLLPKED